MALARAHVWNVGDLLKSADLNGEFNNILLNPIALISPTTGAINFNGQAHTGLLVGVFNPTTGSTGQILAVTSSNSAPTWRTIPLDGGLSTTVPTGGMTYYVSTGATTLLGLAIGSSGQVYTVSTSGVPVWATPTAGSGTVSVLDAVTADTDLSNSTAVNTIYTFSVPGGSLGSSGMLRLTLQGKAQIVSNSWRTMVRFGTTSVLCDVSHGAVAITSSTPMITEVLISADGATNAQISNLREHMYTSVAVVFQNMARATSAIDSTIAQTLIVALEFETAATGNRYVMERATLERLI